MLQGLEEKDHVILLYKRYIGDICTVMEKKKNRRLHTKDKIEKGLNSLDPKGDSVTVEGKGIRVKRTSIGREQEQGVECFRCVGRHERG